MAQTKQNNGGTHDDNSKNYDDDDKRREEKDGEKPKLRDTYYLPLPPTYPDKPRQPWDPFPNENKHHQSEEDFKALISHFN